MNKEQQLQFFQPDALVKFALETLRRKQKEAAGTQGSQNWPSEKKTLTTTNKLGLSKVAIHDLALPPPRRRIDGR